MRISRELEGAAQIGWEEYRANLMVKRGIERTLQLTIEAAIDVGNMLIAVNQWRAPDTNRDIFRVLVEQGVLDCELEEVW